MHTHATNTLAAQHTTLTVVQELHSFITACETLFNNEIYELFEHDISQELRDTIYEYALPNSAEPVRSALNEIGRASGVQSLIEY